MTSPLRIATPIVEALPAGDVDLARHATPEALAPSMLMTADDLARELRVSIKTIRRLDRGLDGTACTRFVRGVPVQALVRHQGGSGRAVVGGAARSDTGFRRPVEAIDQLLPDCRQVVRQVDGPSEAGP
ncbi:MAG TPA: hypothetical protein VMV69_30905 [Pirellulales bacterium]|nr:hypothetical protein [Pirellulales bacterium]